MNTKDIQSVIRSFSDTEVSTKKIIIVPIHTIEHTPYNPSSRTKEGKKFNDLVYEISDKGLLYPILITSDRSVIDGNRRLAACRTLGHTDIECIVCDIEANEAFTAVNTSSMPIGGKGWLEIGLGGGYLPKKVKPVYDELFRLVGSYGIKKLVDKNIGLHILSLCKYAQQLDRKHNLSTLIMFVAERKLSSKLTSALRHYDTREEKVRALDCLLSEHGYESWNS